mmetsp:Transcript_41605/g.69500  ORF Transcript_41605/g.69500 Transcript_41605/m.69500 type:complete len:263 (+) Transcript_41605:227-1015(+)
MHFQSYSMFYSQELIQRNYREASSSRNVREIFKQRVLEAHDESDLKPIFQDGTCNYCFIRHGDLYFIATVTMNANVAVIMAFLYKLLAVFKEYFKSVEEESVKDNFVLIYELLDEMMDNGYPQATEPKILKEFINQSEANVVVRPKAIPTAVTGQTPWRSEGIVHKKNEIFLDVIEFANCLISAEGTVLHAEILGTIKMKSFLSGMPELKLGLNDKVLYEARGRRNKKTVDMEVERSLYANFKIMVLNSGRLFSSMRTPFPV